jgi:hypothetical protein
LQARGDDGGGIVVLGNANAAALSFGIPMQIQHVHQRAALGRLGGGRLLQQVFVKMQFAGLVAPRMRNFVVV